MLGHCPRGQVAGTALNILVAPISRCCVWEAVVGTALNLLALISRTVSGDRLLVRL